MSLLLCHECFFWVEPSYNRCPQCGRVVDTSIPDPPLDVLQKVIGDIDRSLGEIKVLRRLLPDRGTLYATSNGLFFLPHQDNSQTHEARENRSESSLFWALASLAFSPLVLVLPFFQWHRLNAMQTHVSQPQHLDAGESNRLPELLMQNPGVFFVPRHSVRSIARKFRHWRIQRIEGALLRLKPIEDPRQFHARMNELTTSASWLESMNRA